jgi:hypothetical protein
MWREKSRRRPRRAALGKGVARFPSTLSHGERSLACGIVQPKAIALKFAFGAGLASREFARTLGRHSTKFVLNDLTLFGSGYHHVNASAAALATDQPSAPIRHSHLAAVAVGHLGGIGLAPMPTIETPHVPPHARGGIAERHRRAAVTA